MAVACAATPIQTYPGPPLPRAEVALLRDSPDAGIVAIDRVSAWGSVWSLAPGSHEVLVHFRIHTTAPNMSWVIWTYCWVVLPAVAGEDYSSLVRVRKEVIGPSISDKVTMEIGIADSQGVLRGLPRTCLPKRPKIGK
jgi:hypothetical protein